MPKPAESESHMSPAQIEYYEKTGLDFLKYKNLPPDFYRNVFGLLEYGRTVEDSDLSAKKNGKKPPTREDFDKRVDELQINPDFNDVLLLPHPRLNGNVLQILRSMIGPKVGGLPFAVRHIPQRH